MVQQPRGTVAGVNVVANKWQLNIINSTILAETTEGVFW